MSDRALTAAKFIEVDAGVRYWEDAIVNGQQDDEAGTIPLKDGDRWRPTIELATGAVLNWPAGTTADVHYKVCDDGEYWLLDESKRRIAKRKSYYVPDDILCVGDNGFGDYIILTIGPDGLIPGWEPPALDASEWGVLADATNNPVPLTLSDAGSDAEGRS